MPVLVCLFLGGGEVGEFGQMNGKAEVRMRCESKSQCEKKTQHASGIKRKTGEIFNILYASLHSLPASSFVVGLLRFFSL